MSARITLPTPETMTPEQLAVHDAVIRGPRGTIIGPLRAALLNAELADRWQKLGEILRYKTSLPKDINELAIITTARRWSSDLEWQIHAKAALDGGLDGAILDAIRDGRSPRFSNKDQADIYEFTRQIQHSGTVDDSVYKRVQTRWGDLGVVEITAVIGYYTMVAMTLNVHQISLPAGVEPVFDRQNGDLVKLPPASAG